MGIFWLDLSLSFSSIWTYRRPNVHLKNHHCNTTVIIYVVPWANWSRTRAVEENTHGFSSRTTFTFAEPESV